jgi:hypothetical protein
MNCLLLVEIFSKIYLNAYTPLHGLSVALNEYILLRNWLHRISRITKLPRNLFVIFYVMEPPYSFSPGGRLQLIQFKLIQLSHAPHVKAAAKTAVATTAAASSLHGGRTTCVLKVCRACPYIYRHC